MICAILAFFYAGPKTLPLPKIDGALREAAHNWGSLTDVVLPRRTRVAKDGCAKQRPNDSTTHLGNQRPIVGQSNDRSSLGCPNNTRSVCNRRVKTPDERELGRGDSGVAED